MSDESNVDWLLDDIDDDPPPPRSEPSVADKVFEKALQQEVDRLLAAENPNRASIAVIDDVIQRAIKNLTSGN